MQISILNVTVTTVPTAKGSYQMADVAFKNLTYGKVEGKKVMSFGATKDAFGVLSTAQPGQTFTVTVVKNDKGYNDWIALTPSNGAVDSPASPIAGFTAKQAGPGAISTRTSTYETPEERAQRQIFIIRQSSLSNAVATLAVGSKGVKPTDVIDLAKLYENYVFGKADPGPSGFEDMPDFDVPQVG